MCDENAMIEVRWAPSVLAVWCGGKSMVFILLKAPASPCVGALRQLGSLEGNGKFGSSVSSSECIDLEVSPSTSERVPGSMADRCSKSVRSLDPPFGPGSSFGVYGLQPAPSSRPRKSCAPKRHGRDMGASSRQGLGTSSSNGIRVSVGDDISPDRVADDKDRVETEFEVSINGIVSVIDVVEEPEVMGEEVKEVGAGLRLTDGESEVSVT
jgi:hypothetical protein